MRSTIIFLLVLLSSSTVSGQSASKTGIEVKFKLQNDDSLMSNANVTLLIFEDTSSILFNSINESGIWIFKVPNDFIVDSVNYNLVFAVKADNINDSIEVSLYGKKIKQSIKHNYFTIYLNELHSISCIKQELKEDFNINIGVGNNQTLR